MLDVPSIRRDFPILSRTIYGHRLVYFDNAATTQRPVQVVRAVENFYLKMNANVHRGFHTLSQEASEVYEEAHAQVARFINASWDEVAFLRNTTEALNVVAYTLAQTLGKGDKVVVSIMDHHSNILPWVYLSKLIGVRVEYVRVTPDGRLDYDDLGEKAVGAKVVAVSHASNVVGTINDVRRVAKIAHGEGAYLVVDGAQAAPHIPVDPRGLGADFYAFSAHKMLGPMGIGALYYRKDAVEGFDPGVSGGGTIRDVLCGQGRCWAEWADYPWRFEAGTPNVGGAVGFAEAVRYLMRLGMDNVFSHDVELARETLRILGGMEGVRVLGPPRAEERVGLVSFIVDGVHHDKVAAVMDLHGIAVRSGLHCAHPLHRALGVEGSVRASYYIYNTLEEVRYMGEVLRKIVAQRGGGP